MPGDLTGTECRNDEHSFGRGPEDKSGAVLWLAALLFVTASSLLFAWWFEWDRYQIIGGRRALGLCSPDKALVYWLLAAKSSAWFLPLLPLLGILIATGLHRTTAVILNVFWIAVFYLTAADLASVGFSGNHVWDYVPYLRDMIRFPDQRLWQWAGERLTTEATLVLAIFVVSGPLCFVSVRWTMTRLVRRFRWLCSRKALVFVTVSFIVADLGIAPALSLFRDKHLLEQIYPAMPMSDDVTKSLRSMTEVISARLGLNRHLSVRAGLSAVTQPGVVKVAQRGIPLGEDITRDVPFPGFGTEGVSSVGGSERGMSGDYRRSGDDATLFTREDERVAMKVLQQSADPEPADPSAFVGKPNLPNVILIIFESFRHFALGPEMMKELDAWAENGLRLQRHYSGSNCSHLGLFSMFYARTPLGFHRTLDRKIQPQMFESMRRSGYRITCLTAGELEGFRRMHEIVNEKSCDEILVEGDFMLSGMKDWPDSDRRKLERVRAIVNEPRDKPQFLFFYLLSSHYRYAFPPEFQLFQESANVWQFLNPREQIKNHLHRYANSLAFLEREVMQLVRSIDPTRNIVIITGDHGESMGEDGVFTHASRMSEIQLRVPCVMVGPGIEPRKIPTATTHADILPTLMHALGGDSVPIANCQGRDLIADKSPADQVVLGRPKWPEWEGLMLIRGDRRMVFKTRMPRGEVPTMEFRGLLDETGRFELKVGEASQSTAPQASR